jgi:hypothetical protein
MTPEERKAALAAACDDLNKRVDQIRETLGDDEAVAAAAGAFVFVGMKTGKSLAALENIVFRYVVTLEQRAMKRRNER